MHCDADAKCKARDWGGAYDSSIEYSDRQVNCGHDASNQQMNAFAHTLLFRLLQTTIVEKSSGGKKAFVLLEQFKCELNLGRLELCLNPIQRRVHAEPKVDFAERVAA